jgi:hypothetical protein
MSDVSAFTSVGYSAFLDWFKSPPIPISADGRLGAAVDIL